MIKSLFDAQQEYLKFFFEHVDYEKTEAILRKMLSCKGNIILTGVGKSGIIANKIAVTMLSTGTEALFISPTDALHGDMGIVTKDDIVVCFSKSGETKEILAMIPFIRKKGGGVISVVSNPHSSLAKAADLFINLEVKREICPFNLAPTTSPAVQLIFGDILTVALMRNKHFTLDDYAINHPSGSIGKKIVLKVKDVMLKEDELPLCSSQDLLVDVLSTLSEKRCGCLVAVDEKGRLAGVFTDGDLRRAIERDKKGFLYTKIEDLMTKNPKWIRKDILAFDAMQEMEKDPKKLVMMLPVVEDGGKVIGIIRMHDIVQQGI